MLLHHFPTPDLFINSYLIFDEKAKLGVVIDPTRQVEVYLALAMQKGIEITDIVETHVHADFISGARELKAALGGKATIHCSGLGGKEWIPSYADHLVQNGETFHLGSLRLEARHTPGHTPEHLIWVVYDEKRSFTIPLLAFTGDLLFVGSVGRPDLLGTEAKEGLAKQLYHSLFAVLSALPDFLEIYPGHGSGSLCGKGIGMKLSSTLGYEKRCNPWLIPQTYDHWLTSLDLNSLAIPNYFSRMKKLNVEGPSLLEPQKLPLLLTQEQFKNRPLSSLLVDVRHQNEFAAGNIKGSINLPFKPGFTLWAGSLLPAHQELVLVVDQPSSIFSMMQSLAIIGLDNIFGAIDISHWSTADKKEWLTPSPFMTVETLHASKELIYLLDVRREHEWNEGHIEGAHHLELVKVPQMLNAIPVDRPVAVICHTGTRASIIASFLAKEKKITTFNVQGGMQAWIQAKYPLLCTR